MLARPGQASRLGADLRVLALRCARCPFWVYPGAGGVLADRDGGAGKENGRAAGVAVRGAASGRQALAAGLWGVGLGEARR